MTRTNTAEGTSTAIDPMSSAWRSEVVVGRLRTNGLVSLDAPYCRETEASVLVTKPIRFDGRNLFLNIDSAGPGSVQLELRRSSDPQHSMALLTSVPLSANGVAVLVYWNGSATSAGNASAIAAFAGESMRLTIRMQAASLYSLRFA